jgi:TDG/mug DNA glycosylase family protein
MPGPASSRAAHLIEDVLQPNLRVVFCGTALGKASAAAKAYYAHPRNLFWATLHNMGLTQADRPLTPQEYRRVLDFGVGLTDLCKFTSGNDSELPAGAFDIAALRAKIDRYRPAVLAFTSKNAGRAFCGAKAELGWQQAMPFGIRIYILPSTSPSARWQWNDNKVHWKILADAARGVST